MAGCEEPSIRSNVRMVQQLTQKLHDSDAHVIIMVQSIKQKDTNELLRTTRTD